MKLRLPLPLSTIITTLLIILTVWLYASAVISRKVEEATFPMWGELPGWLICWVGGLAILKIFVVLDVKISRKRRQIWLAPELIAEIEEIRKTSLVTSDEAIIYVALDLYRRVIHSPSGATMMIDNDVFAIKTKQSKEAENAGNEDKS